MNKLKEYLWPVVLVAVMIACLFLVLANLSRSAELKTVQEKLDTETAKLKILKSNYQVEESENCMEKTLLVLQEKAKLDREIRQLEDSLKETKAIKKEACDIIDNPSDRILNPQKYFEPIVDDYWNVTFK